MSVHDTVVHLNRLSDISSHTMELLFLGLKYSLIDFRLSDCYSDSRWLRVRCGHWLCISTSYSSSWYNGHPHLFAVVPASQGWGGTLPTRRKGITPHIHSWLDYPHCFDFCFQCFTFNCRSFCCSMVCLFQADDIHTSTAFGCLIINSSDWKWKVAWNQMHFILCIQRFSIVCYYCTSDGEIGCTNIYQISCHDNT